MISSKKMKYDNRVDRGGGPRTNWSLCWNSLFFLNVHLPRSKVIEVSVGRDYSLIVGLLIFSGTKFSQSCFPYSWKCTLSRFLDFAHTRVVWSVCMAFRRLFCLMSDLQKRSLYVTFVWWWLYLRLCERVCLNKYMLFQSLKHTVFSIKRDQEIWLQIWTDLRLNRDTMSSPPPRTCPPIHVGITYPVHSTLRGNGC